MTGSASEISRFLSQVAPFTELSAEALAVLARVSQPRCFQASSLIFCEGDPGEAAYVVQSGVIGIVLSTPDGRELVINELHAGELFGELALLTGQPRSASAVAQTACQVLVIPRAEFLAELAHQPTIMRQLLATLALRLQNSAEREQALAFLDAPARLARVLLQLDHSAPSQGYITISQEVLARHIGITRQTAAKILGQWRRAGWILTGRGRIVLLNRAALRRRLEQSG